MSKKSICPITSKTGARGGGYSNKVRATKFNPTGKVRKKPNMQKKKVFVPELGKSISMVISTKAMRVMQKKGIEKTLKDSKII